MRTIKIFGRSVPIAILAILMCGAVASAGLAFYFSVRGRVDVTERTPVIAEPSSYVVDMAQGDVAYQSITIINRSDLPQKIELETVISFAETGEPVPQDWLTVTYSRDWVTLDFTDDNLRQTLTLESLEVVPIEVTIVASWEIDPGSYAVRTDIKGEVAPRWIESTFYTSENAGDVWFVPLTGTTSAESYSDEIHVNTDEQPLGGFKLTITYDENIIQVVEDSVTGPAGWLITPNYTNAENGQLIVTGATSSPLQGDDVLLLTIKWETKGIGTTALNLTVNDLVDFDTGDPIGIPNGINGERTIVE